PRSRSWRGGRAGRPKRATASAITQTAPTAGSPRRSSGPPRCERPPSWSPCRSRTRALVAPSAAHRSPRRRRGSALRADRLVHLDLGATVDDASHGREERLHGGAATVRRERGLVTVDLVEEVHRRIGGAAMAHVGERPRLL